MVSLSLHVARRILRELGLCATVRAAQVAEVESTNVQALRARAASLELRTRRRAGRLNLLLPHPMSLEALIGDLSGDRGAGDRAAAGGPGGCLSRGDG